MASTEYRGYFIEEKIDQDGVPTGRFFVKDGNGNVIDGPYASIEEAEEAIDDLVDEEKPTVKPMRPGRG